MKKLREKNPDVVSFWNEFGYFTRIISVFHFIVSC